MLGRSRTTRAAREAPRRCGHHAPGIPMRLHRRFTTALSLSLALAACGGGGDDEPSGPTTGGISGSVIAGAEPVVGATVTLSGAASRTTTTSASGGFAFTALAPGSYSVAVALPGSFALAAGQPGTRTATVVAGQTATLSWTAQRASTGGGGDGDGDGNGGQGNVVVVRLGGSSFTPAVLDVPVGTTVRWVVDDGSHTVTPDTRGQAGAWQEAGLTTGQTFEHTFTAAGQTYAYHCTPHREIGMTGTVRVAP